MNRCGGQISIEYGQSDNLLMQLLLILGFMDLRYKFDASKGSTTSHFWFGMQIDLNGKLTTF